MFVVEWRAAPSLLRASPPPRRRLMDLSPFVPGLMAAVGIAASTVLVLVVGRSSIVVRATKKADELESKAIAAGDVLAEKLEARIALLERERAEDRVKIAALEARIHQLESDLEVERRITRRFRMSGEDDDGR